MLAGKSLKCFPVSIVRKTASLYNKAFHAKVFTLFASSQSEITAFASQHAKHYAYCLCFMQDNQAQWFLDMDGIHTTRAWILEQAKKNPKKVFALHDKWGIAWKKYLALCEKIDKTDLKRLSNKELYKLFKTSHEHFLLAGSVAYITDAFMSLGEEDWLEKLLEDELHACNFSDEKLKATLRKLTSPTHFSFNIEAEYHLLKIAGAITKKYQKQYTGQLPLFSEAIKDKAIKKMLEEQEHDFHWIQNNYHNVHYISAEEWYVHMVEIVGSYRKQGKNVAHALAEKEASLQQMRDEREELLSSLKLSSFARNVLGIARLFSKWKDIRKGGVYRGVHYFDVFLDEVSRRTGFTKTDLTFLIFEEIGELLFDQNGTAKGAAKDKASKKELHDEIGKRKEQCFFAVTPKGYAIAGGKDAEKYFKYLNTKENYAVVELKGVVASPGYAKGRVRIIRTTDDMKSLKEGEILVANQTTPEFVPAMKRAAAIVTEQGGITSHAAIISRELKKPCIIGTKIATKALQDNEMVEVDAHKGIVRRMR